MKLIWRDQALEDFRTIIGYIAERNVPASERIADAINACIERALAMPFMYREGRAPGTREAVAHPNYIVIYRPGEDVLEVVNVVHARQNYP